MTALDEALQSGPQRITSEISDINKTLVPYSTIYTSTDNLGSYNKQTIYKPQVSNIPAINSFTEWAGSIASGAASLIGDIAKSAWDSSMSALSDIPNFVNDIGREFSLSNQIDSNNKQLNVLDSQMDNLSRQYRSGQISKDDYTKALSEISKQTNDITNSATDITKQSIDNQTKTATDAINSSIDVATIVCAVFPETAILSPLAIASKDAASAEKMINVLGKSVKVSDAAFENATKIDTVVKAAADAINKVSTINGKFTSGSLVRITQTAVADSAVNATASQIAKNILVGWVIKRPLIYQTNVALAKDIYDDMLKGDLKGAALSTVATAAMALSGGPIGYGLEMIGKAGKYLKTSFESAKYGFAKDSFIDAISAGIGKGDTRAAANYLMKKSAEGDTEYLRKMAAMEAINMKMAGGDSKAAANLVLDYYNSLDDGKFLKGNVVETVLDEMVRHQSATDIVKAAAKRAGWTEADVNRIVAGRMGASDKELIGNILKEADSAVNKNSSTYTQDIIMVRHQLLTQATDRYGRIAAWANNDALLRQIESCIDNNVNTDDMIKAINKIRVGKTIEKGVLTKAETKQLSDMGYTAVLPKRTNTPNIVSSDIKDENIKFTTSHASLFNDDTTIFQQAVKPLPMANTIVTMMSKVGLSPIEAQQEVYDTFRNNFNQYMESAIRSGDISINGNSDTIMTKLYDFTRTYNSSRGLVMPITDLRQMKLKEVMESLNVDEKQAKIVMKSLNSAMLSVPKEIRGLGDKIQDLNMAFNPMQKMYSRIQGTFRFNYNPFFKWQQAYQTEMFAQMEAGGKMIQIPELSLVNKFFFSDKDRLYRDVSKKMEDMNIFGQGYSGQGFEGDVLGKVGTRLTKNEKLSLSGMVSQQARKLGYEQTLNGIEQYINDHFDNVVDTLQTITISGGKSTKSFFDSPLGRTINTVFFPFRFNMKTAGLMAKYMSKLNAPTQVALITTAYHADEWLNSDEGIAWQQKYSNAIKLFNWLSPTYPLTYVLQIGKDIVDPKNASIGDFGLLGGLPFGFISQMLQSNGIIDGGSPYIDPKTGEVYPNYVPNSAKAEVNLAIQDLVGSLFTYPGTIIGLPGKGTMIRTATTGLVGGNEFTAVSQENKLTPQQKKQSQVLQQLSSSSSTVATKTSSGTVSSTSGQTVNRPEYTANPVTVSAKSSSEIPIKIKSSTKSSRLKKSQIPARAPAGATTLK